MRSLQEIIIENNQKAIKDIRELVKENRTEESIVNYCDFRFNLPKNIVKALVREFKNRIQRVD